MCGYIGKYKNMTKTQSFQILRNQPYCYLGSNNIDSIEVVPMYYTISETNDSLVIYFILTNCGENYDNMSSNFNMTMLVTSVINDYCESVFYSVMAKGKFELVENCNEIDYINKLFIKKYKDKCGNPLKSFQDENVIFVKMHIKELSGRKYYKNLL